VRARGVANDDVDVSITVTSGAPEPTDLPNMSMLVKNYPNPFNPTTTLGYAVARSGQVCIRIYDMRGLVVDTLVNEPKSPGFYSVVWDGTNAAGLRLASGVYVARLTTEDQTDTHRMTLVK